MNRKDYEALQIRFSDYVSKSIEQVKELTELAATNKDSIEKSADWIRVLNKKIELKEEEINTLKNNYETKIKNMERSCEIQTAIAREATLQKQLAEKQAAFLERVLEMFTC